MTTQATSPGERNVRGLGWDMDSTFSSNRGELLPIGSFGHTGFTGTSLWIDPATGMFVVFLSNRVHPDGKGRRDAAARSGRHRRGLVDHRRPRRHPQPHVHGTRFRRVGTGAGCRRRGRRR